MNESKTWPRFQNYPIILTLNCSNDNKRYMVKCQLWAPIFLYNS